MSRFISIYLVLFLFATVSLASSVYGPAFQVLDETGLMGHLQLDMAASAGRNFTTQAEFDSYFSNRSLVIVGSGVNGVERAAFAGAAASYPPLAVTKEEKESDWSTEKIRSSNFALVVLVGGPSQNSITRDAFSRGWLGQDNSTYSGFRIFYGKTDTGVLLLAVSDERGFSNAGREAAKYSPLALFVPIQYVPAVATLLSVILLSLLSIARTIFEFKALDIGRKGKKIKEGAWLIAGRNVSELLAIFGASVVLGISISWQYFGPTKDFLFWSAINTFICLFAAIIHEVSHRILAAAFGFKVEYRLWPAGSILTLVSSWLGNAFSVQGFLLEEIPENAVKWKVAAMRVVGPIISAFTMIFFAVLNVFYPSTLFQMVYSISALWAIAESFPFSGLDGKDLKEWNFFIWLGVFIFIAGAYVFVTFLL